MKHKTSQILYAYWNEVRGLRRAPRRFEIEPGRIANILAETFILERLDVRTYQFRLAGTRLCDQFGHEFRGTNFLDGWSDDDCLTVEHNIAGACELGAALVLTFEATGDGAHCVTYEALLLPLLHNGEMASRVLGAMSACDPPAWVGTERLTSKNLLSHTTIWPDAEAGSKLHQQSLHAPSSHSTCAVRIERNRRSFLVLDGGRRKSDSDRD
jgi:hypothetical protein